MYECLEAFDTGCHLASQKDCEIWVIGNVGCHFVHYKSMFFCCSGQNSSGHSWTLSFSHQQVLFTYLQNVSRIHPLLISSTLSSLSLVFPTFILVLLESILILYTLHCADKMYRGNESEKPIMKVSFSEK